MTEKPLKTVLIVGCGYLGTRVAELAGKRGYDVIGIVRTVASAARLNDKGLRTRVLDLDTAVTTSSTEWERATVLYLVPPPQHEADTRIEGFLRTSAAQGLERLVYLSTSGVYGDADGAWVDEARRPAPLTARARRRMSAEDAVRAWAETQRKSHVILRVGGIYGPGRLPVSRLRSGITVICPDEAPYSNRIHVDDLSAVCLAACERSRVSEVYNVADGHPTTMTDYFYQIADMVGLPRPPCVPLREAGEHLSPGMLSFARESKRLVVRKVIRELGIELRYPTLREGLPTCF